MASSTSNNEPRMMWVDSDGNEVSPPTTVSVSDVDGAKMAEEGYRPVEFDQDAILKQMAELQKRLQQMEAERGIPSDKVAAAWQNLRDHVRAWTDADVKHNFQELNDYLANTLDNPQHGSVTQKHVDTLRDLVEEARDNHRHRDLAYWTVLVRDLARAVRD